MTASLSVDVNVIEEISSALDLRLPNKQAVETIAYEVADHYRAKTVGFEGIVESATGVGKTYIVGGALEYFARVDGVRDFVIIAPGRTILRKTIDNFTAGHPRSILGGLSVPITLVSFDTFDSPAVAAAMEDDTLTKLYVFTVQALLSPTTKQGTATHEYQEKLGGAFYQRLQAAKRLVVFADEHHTYYGPKFSAAVRNLSPWALIGLTATPEKRTPPEQIIFRYPLAAAIADRWVKTPIIVGRRDDRHDPQTKLSDGLTLLERKREIVERYCAAMSRPGINPIMLVVARDIDEANEWAGMVRSSDFMGGRYADHDGRVLVIHSDVTGEEEARVFGMLSRVEHPDSPTRIVISVHMLKEGWDVKNVYVLLSTQPSLSEILTEQVLGRGLRLPFGAYTGIEMLDSLEVIAHERYETLLERKHVLNRGFIDYATRTRSIEAPDGSLMIIRERSDIKAPLIEDPAVNAAPGIPNVPQVEPSGPLLTTLDARDGEGAATVSALSQRLLPTKRIALPIIEVRAVESEFQFSDITDYQPFRELGRRLREHPDDELRRTLISALIEVDGDGKKRAVLYSQQAHDSVKAQGALFPTAVLRQRIVDAIMASPLAPSRRAEQQLAVRALDPMLDAFFDGLNGGADELLSAYLERASVRIVEILNHEARRFMRSPTISTQLRMVECAPERINTRPIDRDHYGTFSKQRAYSDWKRSLYGVQWFDSATERQAAVVIDEDSTVYWWTKLHRGEFPILWNSEGQRYNADFVLRQNDGDHWIVEVKADCNALDPEVLAKREVAKRYINMVNASVPASPKWHYVLVTETDIDQAKGSWAALRSLGT